jgi:hypothetical protein
MDWNWLNGRNLLPFLVEQALPRTAVSIGTLVAFYLHPPPSGASQCRSCSSLTGLEP